MMIQQDSVNTADCASMAVTEEEQGLRLPDIMTDNGDNRGGGGGGGASNTLLCKDLAENIKQSLAGPPVISLRSTQSTVHTLIHLTKCCLI